VGIHLVVADAPEVREEAEGELPGDLGIRFDPLLEEAQRADVERVLEPGGVQLLLHQLFLDRGTRVGEVDQVEFHAALGRAQQQHVVEDAVRDEPGAALEIVEQAVHVDVDEAGVARLRMDVADAHLVGDEDAGRGDEGDARRLARGDQPRMLGPGREQADRAHVGGREAVAQAHRRHRVEHHLLGEEPEELPRRDARIQHDHERDDENREVQGGQGRTAFAVEGAERDDEPGDPGQGDQPEDDEPAAPGQAVEDAGEKGAEHAHAQLRLAPELHQGVAAGAFEAVERNQEQRDPADNGQRGDEGGVEVVELVRSEKAHERHADEGRREEDHRRRLAHAHAVEQRRREKQRQAPVGHEAQHQIRADQHPEQVDRIEVHARRRHPEWRAERERQRRDHAAKTRREGGVEGAGLRLELQRGLVDEQHVERRGGQISQTERERGEDHAEDRRGFDRRARAGERDDASVDVLPEIMLEHRVRLGPGQEREQMRRLTWKGPAIGRGEIEQEEDRDDRSGHDPVEAARQQLDLGGIMDRRPRVQRVVRIANGRVCIFHVGNSTPPQGGSQDMPKKPGTSATDSSTGHPQASRRSCDW